MMLTVHLFLPFEHDLDLEDFDARNILQDGLEAKLGPIDLYIAKRRYVTRPVVVILGECHPSKAG